MANPRVVTRFAPSPTGYLHVGGARTALFNWLLARHTGGQFLLRIEDTDLARSTRQAGAQLLEDLKWLGLQWDNPELVYQSRRQDVYNPIIDDLINRGLAYKAYETPAEIEAMRKEDEKRRKGKGQFVYRRGPVDAALAARYEAEGRPSVVRFMMPEKEYKFTDHVLGEIVVPADEAEHFVIRKSDGMPTYHLAVVVDDQAMNVTHVLRGQEHLKNTPRHIALQEALGYPRPNYAHLTTIQNPDGSKMGKRDRDKAIRQRAQEWLKSAGKTVAELSALTGLPEENLARWLADSKKQLDIPEQTAVMQSIGLHASELPEILVHDFRRNGYLPEVLLNFLALLGWSPGGDRERMTIDQMVQLFSLERVGKSNPKFDRGKLLAFGTEAAAAAPMDRLVRALRDYLLANPDSPLNAATDQQLARLLSMKKGFRLLREVDEPSRFLFLADEQITYEPDAVEKALKKQDGQGLAALRELRHILASVPHWNAATLDETVKQYAQRCGLGLGKVAQPLRVAVSGTAISPPIFESLEFLGRDHTLARIDRCLATVG
jgi:glutamyl/glutaminyl-tRNA synthetase